MRDGARPDARVGKSKPPPVQLRKEFWDEPWLPPPPKELGEHPKGGGVGVRSVGYRWDGGKKVSKGGDCVGGALRTRVCSPSTEPKKPPPTLCAALLGDGKGRTCGEERGGGEGRQGGSCLRPHKIAQAVEN